MDSQAPNPLVIRHDEDALSYASLKALSEQDRRILRFIAKFPDRHRFPALPQDVESALGLNNDQVMYALHKLEAIGYVEMLMLRDKLRGIVCTGMY